MIGKQRISATIDADVLAAAEKSARAGNAKNLSAWISDAMRLKLDDDRRRQALAAFIADFETEHGIITDEDIARVERDMARRALVVRGRKRARRAVTKHRRR